MSIKSAKILVCNTRTVWTHLVIEKGVQDANDALRLYRDSDQDSKMAYDNWTALHADLSESMKSIAEKGYALATKKGLKLEESVETSYLWADAISNTLYEAHHT